MFRRKLMLLVAGLVVVVAGLSVSALAFQAQLPYYPSGSGNEFYAAKLGIWYRLVPYGYGGYPQQAPGAPQQVPGPYGARLSRYPVPGSPCAYLQLEPGDMIISLDDLPFYGPNDVLSHYGQTSMIFINVRTGQPQPAYLNLN